MGSVEEYQMVGGNLFHIVSRAGEGKGVRTRDMKAIHVCFFTAMEKISWRVER